MSGFLSAGSALSGDLKSSDVRVGVIENQPNLKAERGKRGSRVWRSVNISERLSHIFVSVDTFLWAALPRGIGSCG